MHGGLYGATDMNGRVTEPGWAACGYETTKDSPLERTWVELTRSRG